MVFYDKIGKDLADQNTILSTPLQKTKRKP